MGLDHPEETPTPFSAFLNTEYSRFLKKHGLLDEYLKDIAHCYVHGQYTPIVNRLPANMTPDAYTFSQTVKFLEQSQTDQPLFLTVSFPGPHTPIDPPEKYSCNYEPNKLHLPENYNPEESDLKENDLRKIMAFYMSKISHLDERIGEIINVLKKRGNWENTIFIFTSDHGDRMGEHGIVSKTGFEEGSARIPLIIRAPETIKQRQAGINYTPVSLLDLYPTVIEAAGGTIPKEIQGHSLMPIISGKENKVNDVVFSEIAARGHFNYMVRTQEWKWYVDAGIEKLFDMENDSWEKNNLADKEEYSKIIKQMKFQLLDFLMNTQLDYAKLENSKNLFDFLEDKFEGFKDYDDSKKVSLILEELKNIHK